VTTNPEIAFRVREHDEPTLDIRVNFSVFAGRQATPAEIDDLARELAREVDEFAIVAEERHEFAGAVEASVGLVRVEVPRGAPNCSADELGPRLVRVADEWARACIADRAVEATEL
jgi:hypothetical protein